jgi:MATE family multidrug resistance protein
LWLARDALTPAVLRAGLARLGNRVAVARMFTASRDIMGRTILLQLSFTSFVFLGARFGDVTLAANQVLLQFLEITAYALDGFAISAETLVGQAVGARAAGEVRRASRICMQWGFGGAAVMALCFALTGGLIIDLMTTAPDVRIEARWYLWWLVAAPLIGVASWIYDGIFIGALQTREMLRAMMISVAVYAVALVVLIPTMGNHGLWAALMVLNITRGITMRAAYPKVLAKAEAA